MIKNEECRPKTARGDQEMKDRLEDKDRVNAS